MHKFHLLKERFLRDDYDSGLYFDLFPIKRPKGDEDVFNDAIEEACAELEKIEPKGQAWLPTLFLNETQIANLPVKYQGMFSGKSYLLLFKPEFDGKELPHNMWFDQAGGGLVCNPNSPDQSNWVYWSSWGNGGEELGHRFRRVEKSEVDEYEYTAPTPPAPPANDDEPGDETTAPPVVIGDGFVHMKCPHCGKSIF